MSTRHPIPKATCCVCGGLYPWVLTAWWYEETGKALRLGGDGDEVALAVVAAPELKMGALCSRRCGLEADGILGGVTLEPSVWAKPPAWLLRMRAEAGEAAEQGRAA